MAIGIIIKRVTKQGDNAKILLPHIIELRALAVRQPGYISGETFFNIDRPEECLVIGRWTSLEHWQQWMMDPRRVELDGNMENYLVSMGCRPCLCADGASTLDELDRASAEKGRVARSLLVSRL